MTHAGAARITGYWGHLQSHRGNGVRMLFLRAFLPFLAVLVLAGAVAFNWRMSALDRELDTTIDAFLDFASARLQRDLQAPIEDLNFLCEELARLGPSASATAEFANLARARGRYPNVRVFDRDGIEQMKIAAGAIAPTLEPLDWSRSNLFSSLKSLRDAELYISSFELRTERGKILEPLEPMIRFAKPFVGPNMQRGGYVVIELDAREALGALKVANPNGFVELLTGEGYWVKSRDPKLEWGAVLREREHLLFSTHHARAWESMAHNDGGALRTENGGFWFRTVRPLVASQANPRWTLLLHVPQERMQARIRGVATGLAILALAAALMAAPFYWWLARRAHANAPITGLPATR